MRARIRATLGLVVVFALVAAACGDDEVADTTTTTTTTAPTTTTTTEPPVDITLLVWADVNRAPAVQAVAPAFTEATGVDVEVQIVDFGEIRGQVQTAGPAGEGPDLFVGAHDWTGELAANGVVEPIDLAGRGGDFFQVALDAFSYEGDLYAVPYATEAVALYYNAELVDEPPATWDEMVAICDGLTGITNCVGVPGGGDGADAYHNYPFVSAFGGYIFQYDPAAGFDPDDVGLDSDGAIAGAEFLESQVAAGIVGAYNYGDAKNLFLEGMQPFWLTGPWEVGALQESGMDWGVTKLPTMDGNTPQPFVGAQGFFLSAFSEHRLVAQSFLLDFIATTETMKALYDADPRNPAHRGAFDLIADDPVAATFALSAADGVPMPNIPEMGSVWGPLGDNLLAIRNGDLAADEAMENAARGVRDALAG
jgi:arabinogalactan oligomer / maltooligosaccharide transport system substrate-binding protein